MALQWLFLDSIAPILGVTITMFVTLPERFLGITLGLFTGFFLYIGASDLVPESHHSHPRFLTTLMTIIGAGVLYIAIRIAGI
jgi:ZIP family zinc transporter